MPRTISREQALERIAAEARGGCFLCALAREPPLVAGEHALVTMPRYAVRWGHAMVVTRAHVTRFSECELGAWSEASALGWRTARAIEAALGPVRCYVAALGSARDDLPMTCPHLHLHVVPIYDKDDKPSDVLTWSHGVVIGDDDERRALCEALRAHWPEL